MGVPRAWYRAAQYGGIVYLDVRSSGVTFTSSSAYLPSRRIPRSILSLVDPITLCAYRINRKLSIVPFLRHTYGRGQSTLGRLPRNSHPRAERRGLFDKNPFSRFKFASSTYGDLRMKQATSDVNSPPLDRLSKSGDFIVIKPKTVRFPAK